MKNFVVSERKHHLNFAKDQELKMPAVRLCLPRDLIALLVPRADAVWGFTLLQCLIVKWPLLCS